MSNHDPEIDPSIRLEEEELLRELQEEQAREDEERRLMQTVNKIIDQRESQTPQMRQTPPRRERFSSSARKTYSTAAPSDTPQSDNQPKEKSPQENDAPKAKSKKKSKSNDTMTEMFSGSFLDTMWMRKYYPYLLGGTLLLLLYLMSSFSVQRLHHTRQVLEKRLLTTRTDAVNMSRNVKSVSSRSAVVKRAKEMGLNLEESLKPVKVIEK